MNFRIRYVKVTAVFDRAYRGNLRYAMRLIIETTQEIEKELRLFILVKNDRGKVGIRDLNGQYNKRFLEVRFRSVAGANDRFANPEEKKNSVQFTITEYFKENVSLVNRTVQYSKSLNCTKIETIELVSISKDLEENISEDDILIEVKPGVFPTGKDTLIMFQLAFVLDGFVDENTLSRWKSLGKVWSVNFDFHEKIEYEDFSRKCGSAFTYPEAFEFWVYIPRGHTPISSSPRYEGAFGLGVAETQYKITGKEFETDENDFAVKLMNGSGKPEKFSVICFSPLVGEKQLAAAERKIRHIEEKVEEYPSWRDFIQNMVLTVALFSLLIGAIVILAQQAIQGSALQSSAGKLAWQDVKIYFSASFALIVEISVFVGFSFWGVYSSLRIISEKYGKFEFVAFASLIILGLLGVFSQIYQGQSFLEASVLLISVLFIIFGLLALLIRILEKNTPC